MLLHKLHCIITSLLSLITLDSTNKYNTILSILCVCVCVLVFTWNLVSVRRYSWKLKIASTFWDLRSKSNLHIVKLPFATKLLWEMAVTYHTAVKISRNFTHFIPKNAHKIFQWMSRLRKCLLRFALSSLDRINWLHRMRMK